MSREFVSIGNGEHAKQSLRIMQWNILARGLTSTDGLPQSNPEHLDFEKCRLPQIVSQILQYKPAILSLEELDQKDALMAHLASHGYECVYAANPDSPCLLLKPPSEYGPDGIAIIYRPDIVKLLEHESIQLPMPTSDRFKLALTAVFQTNDGGYKIRFVAIHLKAKKGFAAIRVEQLKAISKYLETQQSSEHQVDISILSGDFNAEPEEPVIKMCIDEGFCSATPIHGTYSTAKIQRDQRDNTKVARHVRLIDYIFFKFYARAKFSPTSYLNMPNVADLEPNLLPNSIHPSDHLPLVVDFGVF